MRTVLSVLGLAVAVWSFRLAWVDRRADPHARPRGLDVTLAAVVHVAAGLAMIAVLLPGLDDGLGPILLTGFLYSWLAYGLLWLFRLAPRQTRPSSWIVVPWARLDTALLALAAAFALAAALG